MTDETPLGGFAMRDALTDVAPPEAADLAREYLASLDTPGWRPSEIDAAAHHHLWLALIRSAHRGELEFRGVPEGGRHTEVIRPAMLRGSKPNFGADTLEAVGTVFHAVGVFRSVAAAETEAAAAVTETQSEPVSEPELLTLRTGGPGRPATSVHLCFKEMEMRGKRGELSATLRLEAQHLVSWVKYEHGDLRAPTLTTVENNIRVAFKSMKAGAPKR